MLQKNILTVLSNIILLIFLLGNISTANADLFNNIAYYAQHDIYGIQSDNNIYLKTTKKSSSYTLKKLLDWGYKCSGVPQHILLAIILTESGGNPYAVNVNGVGGFYPKSKKEALKIIYKFNKANTDIGIMQVNYLWVGRHFNVTPEELLDPWINICVGAKELRSYLDKYNWTWKGIGRYNAVTEWKQVRYAIKVSKNLEKAKKWQNLID